MMSKDKSLFLLLRFVFIVFGSFLEACRENPSCLCHLSSAAVLDHDSPVIVPRTAVVPPPDLDLAYPYSAPDYDKSLAARVENLERASKEQFAALTVMLAGIQNSLTGQSGVAASSKHRPTKLSRRSSASSIRSASSQGIDSVPEGPPGSEDGSDSEESDEHPSSGGHSAGSKTPEGATDQYLTPPVEVYGDGRPSCLGLCVVDLEEPVYGASAGAGDGRVYDRPSSPTMASYVRRAYVPSSPQPTYRDEVPDPGIFKKLHDGAFNPIVVFNHDGLFCFVGLMSNTYQASVSTKKVEWGFDSSKNPVEAAKAVSEELTGGASVDAAVKFALQLTCATGPANSENDKTQWARVDSTIKDKGEFLFELLNFVMVKFGILPPDQNAYGTRTWHNAGAPFQTVKWPHLNWAASCSSLPFDVMKARLKDIVPEIALVSFRVVAEAYYAYLMDSFTLSHLKQVDIRFLNAQWPSFKETHASLFPVRAEENG